MRRLLSLVLIALLLPAVPTLAQAEPIRVITDPTGDMVAELKGGPGITDPTGHYDFQDIEWVDVLEDADGYWFTVKVVSIEVELDNTIGFSDGGYIRIFFVHNDWDYFLEIERPSGQLEIEYYARLYSKSSASDDWGRIWLTDTTTFDLNANTITQFVAREDLPDSKGAAPFPGRELTQFYAITGQRSSDFRGEIGGTGQTFEAPWHLGDAAPDDGPSDAVVPVQFGLEQSGDARLTVDEPYRASNGEETTFLYTVNATNVGANPDLFVFEAKNIPSTWDVTVVLPAVELGPGESATIPVLLATQFAHIHGGSQSFLLTMEGTENPQSIGRAELGIRYLETPQPAGHHETVYFHSTLTPITLSFNSAFNVLFAPNGQLYFNTNTPEDDPDDDGQAITGFGFTFGQETTYFWEIPLNPTLRMGLDFDLSREGQFMASFSSELPLNQAVLEGELLLVGEDPNGNGNPRDGFDEQVTTLATFSSDPQDVTAGGRMDIAVPVTVTPESDYIPYDPANNILLQLRITGQGVTVPNQNTAMAMLPGGSMDLPMFDYEDDVTDVFETLAGPQLTAAAPIRTANPGDLIRFDVTMADTGAAAGDYQLEFMTEYAPLATVLEGNEATVPDGGSVPLTVTVEVPEDATQGEKLDLFLQAVNKNDPLKRGIVRLVVDVDLTQEWDDDRASVDTTEEESSPGIGILALLGAVAVALRRR